MLSLRGIPEDGDLMARSPESSPTIVPTAVSRDVEIEAALRSVRTTPLPWNKALSRAAPRWREGAAARPRRRGYPHRRGRAARGG